MFNKAAVILLALGIGGPLGANEGPFLARFAGGIGVIPVSNGIGPANEDGTFRPAQELRTIYTDQLGLSPDDDVVAYCRIGERSSHTWFVLRHLLGYPQVRNYDGSWTEWGNLVRAPVVRGDEPGGLHP